MVSSFIPVERISECFSTFIHNVNLGFLHLPDNSC